MQIPNNQFLKYIRAINNAKNVQPFTGTLLAFDPGHTTGVSIFSVDYNQVPTTTMDAGQIITWPMKDGVENLTRLFDRVKPTCVVYELYAIYDWKTDDHSWSQVPTLHVIGCIETLCIQRGIPYYSQTAQIAKNFCTDAKLQEWGVYQVGQKHARDSIRHASYFLMFGKSENS